MVYDRDEPRLRCTVACVPATPDSFLDSGDHLGTRLCESEAALQKLCCTERNVESVLTAYRLLEQTYWEISLYESRWHLMTDAEVVQLSRITSALPAAEAAVTSAAADGVALSQCEDLLRATASQYLDDLDEQNAWWHIEGELGRWEIARELSMYLSGRGMERGTRRDTARPSLHTRPICLLVRTPVWVRDLVVARAAYHQQWTVASPALLISNMETSLSELESDYLVGLWRTSSGGRYKDLSAATAVARRLGCISSHRNSSWTTNQLDTQSPT
jgi:hypothetical protein